MLDSLAMCSTYWSSTVMGRSIHAQHFDYKFSCFVICSRGRKITRFGIFHNRLLGWAHAQLTAQLLLSGFSQPSCLCERAVRADAGANCREIRETAEFYFKIRTRGASLRFSRIY